VPNGFQGMAANRYLRAAYESIAGAPCRRWRSKIQARLNQGQIAGRKERG
jgi:hypothetical protein